MRAGKSLTALPRSQLSVHLHPSYTHETRLRGLPPPRVVPLNPHIHLYALPPTPPQVAPRAPQKQGNLQHMSLIQAQLRPVAASDYSKCPACLYLLHLICQQLLDALRGRRSTKALWSSPIHAFVRCRSLDNTHPKPPSRSTRSTSRSTQPSNATRTRNTALCCESTSWRDQSCSATPWQLCCWQPLQRQSRARAVQHTTPSSASTRNASSAHPLRAAAPAWQAIPRTARAHVKPCARQATGGPPKSSGGTSQQHPSAPSAQLALWVLAAARPSASASIALATRSQTPCRLAAVSVRRVSDKLCDSLMNCGYMTTM